MRKGIIVVLTIALIAGALAAPAEAGKRKKKKKPPAPVKVERVVEHKYNMGSPGVPGVASACLASVDSSAGCVNIETAAEETFVKVEVKDTTNANAYFILAQDTDTSTPAFEIFAEFCGTTGEEAVSVPAPGTTLRVSVYTLGGPACPGISTTGSLTATLSNLP